MLAKSDYPVERAIHFFTSRDLEVGFLVPTRTGLQKSIMDAHAGLRTFLTVTGIHDFVTQLKGLDGKRVIPATFVGCTEAKDTQVSLYRPETKDGDPRIWIYGLQRLAAPGNLLALFVVRGHLYITNVSDSETWASREDPDAPLGAILADFASSEDLIARELVAKLRDVARAGWIKSQRRGDTGIGYTLEALLGIRANANREPDYKGIELKSARAHRAGRNNLFAKTPDWARSPVQSSRELLKRFGRYDPTRERARLYATVYGSHPSPGGFKLCVVDDDTYLCHVGTHVSRLTVWSNRVLEHALVRKHASTFWIKADARQIEGREEFRFHSVRYTRSPMISAFVPLIETGGVTVDLTCFADGAFVKDKGYLWKVAPRSFDALFPHVKEIEL